VAVLVVQLVIGGGFVWVAVHGLGFLARAATPRASPAVSRPHGEHFDSRRAFAQLRFQVAVGPRPAGSVALRHLADRLRRQLPHGRFEDLGPSPPGLRNIVGMLPGRPPAVVLAAHYDSKDIPGTGPGGSNGFLGANDGAAGTAAVIELARDLRRVRRPHGHELRFVLFDGEEAPRGVPDGEFYAAGDRGSKAYLAAHPHQIGALVLLDFIANRHLLLPREAGSDRRLWARLRAAADRVGVGAVFPAQTVPEIEDDHTPFARAGIPAIDLIDFDYPCFHRACDTPAQLSPASLAAAGEAVFELLRTM